ncbi:MAG: hypothetical protein Q4D56_10275 [Bacteroides sp.]|nr:hypothetical protein [Bacteroides sp.]
MGLFPLAGSAQNRTTEKIPTIYVDRNGVMRWSDTKEEASFFGVNYTLPFAHAYRVMGYRGIDRKEAIDRDVYHMARLGINAYRIHLWDVEITDAQGHLLENDHLDLLDYLICKLQERGIRTFITAQTDFGNGYPERNEPTGGFSYQYDKCSVHSEVGAIAAQETYLGELVRHVNPYTGQAYKDDPYIVGFEVNNEPCHAGTVAETRNYINRMLRALRRAGNRKPVFYNVSHNGHVVQAYYDTAIDGTTYQWYPLGLVSGQTRRGNFLPFVDSYDIPFSDVKGFDRKARMVYEFDPADNLCTYLYPATVRTFRTAGFQWMTQFAYDPIDMAAYNTEYQTHYLNAAYTPGKAVGLMIAARVAQAVGRGETFGSYPADTLFSHCRVSAAQDLSEWNDGEAFYYSNNTRTQPKDAARLQAVAGRGSSPVVSYEGTGMYWLDRLEEGVWRLEVMPDAVVMNDPFAKPSLDKEVVSIFSGAWDMTLRLPDLGKHFSLTGLNEGNHARQTVNDGTIAAIRPGAYLLQRKGVSPQNRWEADTRWGNIRLGEYVQPELSRTDWKVIHTPTVSTDADKPLHIEATVAGMEKPDSVLLYTDRISFWNEHNPYIKMNHAGGYTYTAIVPDTEVKEGCFRYIVVVCKDGNCHTFPAGVARSPLDWDYTAAAWWETQVARPDAPLLLWEADSRHADLETYILPEWSRADHRRTRVTPTEKPMLNVTFQSDKEQPVFFLRRYIKDEVSGRPARLSACRTLCVQLRKKPEGLKAGFITATGYTYLADCPAVEADGIARVPLTALRQTDTALLPYAYPSFLDNYFHPQTDLPFRVGEVETLEFRVEGKPGKEAEIEIGSVWLE